MKLTVSERLERAITRLKRKIVHHEHALSIERDYRKRAELEGKIIGIRHSINVIRASLRPIYKESSDWICR